MITTGGENRASLFLLGGRGGSNDVERKRETYFRLCRWRVRSQGLVRVNSVYLVGVRVNLHFTRMSARLYYRQWTFVFRQRWTSQYAHTEFT